MAKLNIAIDPGFDSVKVIANGIAFKFPFNVIRTDEGKMDSVGNQANRIIYTSRRGDTFRVGEYARARIFEMKGSIGKEMETFYTENRFEEDNFLIGLNTAVGMALKLTHLDSEAGTPDISMCIALPQSMLRTFTNTVLEKISGDQIFSLRLGNDPEKKYKFSINPKKMMTVSQTIAAIIGETSTEDGRTDETKEFLLRNVLVLDGGYYTLGIVPITHGGSIDIEKTRSDTEHTMKVINSKVAAEILPYRPYFQHYMVEYMISQGNCRCDCIRDGKRCTLNLQEIRNQKIEEVCMDLIGMLDRDYDHLMDFRHVLVTGGTGQFFYPYLEKYYGDDDPSGEKRILLTSSTLGGNALSFEYSVVVGAYKGLIANL